jgi:MOSC domain-containing protein YiiM
MQIDAAVPAHVPVAERAPDRDFAPSLPSVEAAPKAVGRLEAIAVRPTRETRRTVDQAELDVELGVVGDNWLARGSSSSPDGSPQRDSQVTLISTRVLAAIEPDPARWPLAGDQLYVDFDLSQENLPAGALLEVGEAVLEVSPAPHVGCAKFSARFGSDALKWTNTAAGRAFRMRGMNAMVVRGGTVRVGDEVRKA